MKPYYENDLGKLYHGDCLEVMDKLQDPVDLILTDPPYNINKDKWDKIDNYIEWMGLNFLECQRLLKDNGTMYFFHNMFSIIIDLYNWINRNTNFVFKQFITWSKIHEQMNNIGYVEQRLAIDMMRNYYNGFTEYILFYTFQDSTGLQTITDNFIKPLNPFSKYLKEEFKRANVSNKEISKLFLSKTGGLTGCVSNWLNGDNVITKDQYLKIRDFLNNEYLRKEYEDLRKEYEDLRKEYEDLRKEYEDQRYTFNTQIARDDLRSNSNTWVYPPSSLTDHVTQKPILLIENILKHSSNKNDLVLDFTAGSGTTGVACHRLQRRYILIEKEEKYCQIIKERLIIENQKRRLF